MDSNESAVLSRMKEREQCFSQLLTLMEQSVIKADDAEGYVELMERRQ
jgi:hypothetical protein